jgi:hypothetical protein
VFAVVGSLPPTRLTGPRANVRLGPCGQDGAVV